MTDWICKEVHTDNGGYFEPVAELIRCKDCKYMAEHYDTDGNAPYWTCLEWDSGTDYDGFCHYAERKEE